jgi:hypothetical protein
MLTVGELRKLIEGVDDRVLVVVPASDHSYSRVVGCVGIAITDGYEMYEDHGDEPEPGCRRITVLIIGG